MKPRRKEDGVDDSSTIKPSHANVQLGKTKPHSAMLPAMGRGVSPGKKPGSLASFMNTTLGVNTKGNSTGLVRQEHDDRADR